MVRAALLGRIHASGRMEVTPFWILDFGFRIRETEGISLLAFHVSGNPESRIEGMWDGRTRQGQW